MSITRGFWPWSGKELYMPMPHCGMKDNTTSGGEVAERELITNIDRSVVQYEIVRPSWRGLRWWNSLLYYHRPMFRAMAPAYWTHNNRPNILIRAHSLRYTGLPALWWGRRRDIPVSVHYHHLERDRLTWLDEFVIKHADQVTTDSQFSAAQCTVDTKHGIDVIRLGVDHQRFTPWPRPEAAKVVLLVGGTKRRKNIRYVQDLWPRIKRLVPNAYLNVVGEGHVCTDDGMVKMYRTATVVAMPSRLEGFGLPVLEAMATGRPVVCSNLGALPEFGIETTSLAYPDRWVERIVTLLTNETQWREESERNLEIAKTYSWEQTAERAKDLWLRAATKAHYVMA